MRYLSRLLCVLTFVATAFADDASHLAKAREYLRVTQAEATSKQTMDAMLANVQSLIDQQGRASNIPPEAVAVMNEFQGRIAQLIRETASWDAIKGDMEKLAVRTFSEQELDDLISFYETPSGQSVAAKTGIFATQAAALGQARSVAMMPRIQALTQEMSNRMLEAVRQRPVAPVKPAK